ncbi:hypothetical protein C8R44DRAFT_873203 [Mycena epipterygia]|nr:hypothetical protein C8R44DRAFT_873203 [Mycena epipterygia]
METRCRGPNAATMLSPASSYGDFFSGTTCIVEWNSTAVWDPPEPQSSLLAPQEDVNCSPPRQPALKLLDSLFILLNNIVHALFTLDTLYDVDCRPHSIISCPPLGAHRLAAAIPNTTLLVTTPTSDQCCDSIVQSSSEAASKVAAILGLSLAGLNVPVGLDCSPTTVGGNVCGSTTVVCDAPDAE